jgi:N-acetylglutamate synthase-like GNAT family acetyltransferase
MSFETFKKYGLIFREAVKEDFPKILAFVDIFLRRDYFLRRSELFTKMEMATMIIVFHNDKLVALAVMGKNKTLWHLLVHPKYRGKHIGETLVQKLRPEIIRSKLDQSTGDPTGFYEKIGYRIEASKKGRKRNINIMERAV